MADNDALSILKSVKEQRFPFRIYFSFGFAFTRGESRADSFPSDQNGKRCTLKDSLDPFSRRKVALEKANDLIDLTPSPFIRFEWGNGHIMEHHEIKEGKNRIAPRPETFFSIRKYEKGILKLKFIPSTRFLTRLSENSFLHAESKF